MMLSNRDKLELVNLKLSFWQERLQESNSSIPMLQELGNQDKIASNILDIQDYVIKIEVLEGIKNDLETKIATLTEEETL
jgi:hypothetical protein